MSKKYVFYALLFASLLITGCGETRYLLRYEKPAQEKVWPSLPDKPRYRFVGQLTGEANLEAQDDGGAGAAIKNFFKMLVGLGSGSDQTRTLLRPQSGVVDANGRIIVTDAGRQAIFVFDEKQGQMLIWRDANEEYGFVSPVGVGVANNGDVLIADAELRRVVRLDAQGKPKAEFGVEDLERPTGLAIDPASGKIYVADTVEHNIKVYADNGKLEQVIGQAGTGPGQFNAPTHLAFEGGKLYVTDTFNSRIQIFDSAGKFINELGSRGLYLGNLVRPKGVTADSAGNVYIIESFHDYLLVYDASARFLLPIGGTGSGVGEFYLPAGVWVDDRDRIYVADMYNGRVAIFQYLQGRFIPGHLIPEKGVLKTTQDAAGVKTGIKKNVNAIGAE